MSKNIRHFFHIVDASPWPFIGSIGALTITNGAVLYFHNYNKGGYILLLGLFIILFTMYVWWRDIIRESTFGGFHTEIVQLGLRLGMVLFIISEVMFFFSFFWAFFHSSLAPTIEIGSIWPPEAIKPFNPWDVPFLNTLILLCSGITITWSHHCLILAIRHEALFSLILTILLAFFTFLQVFEYKEASFNISDGIYGSTFFMATGFHGFHVLVGTIFLIVCFFRILQYQVTNEHHFGFEAAAWYWHFVDVVWLFLFISIYWWGTII